MHMHMHYVCVIVAVATNDSFISIRITSMRIITNLSRIASKLPLDASGTYPSLATMVQKSNQTAMPQAGYLA